MRVIVCGGRDYTDREAITETLRKAFEGRGTFGTLVHGTCRGADLTAAEVAAGHGLAVEPFPPPLAVHGSPRAFHIRNQAMADAGADLCLAFPGGAGTADCVRRCERAGIPVRRLPDRGRCAHGAAI